MNNKKNYILAAIAAASSVYVPAMYGQNMVDGVRFGSSDITGTARYRSMAGAFGALGGDLSCMSDNPAGMAIFRGTNTISITPHLGFTGTETRQDISGAEKATGKDNTFSVSNFGAVFSFMPEDNDYIVNFNLGFSIDRKLQTYRKMNAVIDHPSDYFGGYLDEQANMYLADYYDQLKYDQVYFTPDKFLNMALGPDGWSNGDAPLFSLMGYESGVLNPISNNKYRVQVANFDQVFQRTNLLERTRHDSYNISGSVNINDVLYAGVTFRITDFNSTLEHCFSEDDHKVTPEELKNGIEGDYITYDNAVETKGSGFGINLGLLWKPTEAWRIGAAVHTPVWMTMKEITEASMETYNIFVEEMWKKDPTIPNYCDLDPDMIEYKYSTPWEYQFSTAYVIGTRAIVSLEYDITDFKTMKFDKALGGSDADKYYYEDMNGTMKSYLKAQHTFKAGVEYRLNPQFSLRAGYAYKSSPYTKEALYTAGNPDDIAFLYRTATKPNYSTLDDQHYITGGFGWRGKKWSIDLSCMSHSIKEYYSPYPCDFADSDVLDFNTHTLSWDLSFGYRF